MNPDQVKTVSDGTVFPIDMKNMMFETFSIFSFCVILFSLPAMIISDMTNIKEILYVGFGIGVLVGLRVAYTTVAVEYEIGQDAITIRRPKGFIIIHPKRENKIPYNNITELEYSEERQSNRVNIYTKDDLIPMVVSNPWELVNSIEERRSIIHEAANE